MRQATGNRIHAALRNGLRRFPNNPRGVPGLVQCYNIAPAEQGLEVHETITSLGATGVSWGGEGQRAYPSTSRSITIRTRDYADFTDVPDVSVYLDGAYMGTTDSDGEITIAGVEVGGHSIRLTVPSYETIGVGSPMEELVMGPSDDYITIGGSESYDSDEDDLLNDYIMVV